MQDGLSGPLKAVLAQYRMQAEFREMVLGLKPRTFLRPYHPNKPSKEQQDKYIYESGVMAGEENIIRILLQSELGKSTI